MLRVLAILLVLLPLPAGAAQLDFTVVRKGTTIGTHIVTIRPQGNETTVDVTSNIAVRALYVTVYRFVHKSRELWQGGRLQALDGVTDDDGDEVRLSVQAAGPRLRVEKNGRESTVEGDLLTASLWNKAAVTRPHLLDTITGAPLAIRVQDRGEETVMVRGRPTAARRYSVTGGLQREVWYDADGMLAQVQMKAEDGSEVRFELR